MRQGRRKAHRVRRAAKVDANQPAIIAALRAVGCSVQPLHTVGQGCPDLLVGKAGRTFVMEIKDGAKPPSERKLTPDQIAWHGAWRGVPVLVVIDEAQAIRHIEEATT